jgi:hypothetical protein
VIELHDFILLLYCITYLTICLCTLGYKHAWCMNIFISKSMSLLFACNLQIFYMMKIDAHKEMGTDLFLEI